MKKTMLGLLLILFAAMPLQAQLLQFHVSTNPEADQVEPETIYNTGYFWYREATCDNMRANLTSLNGKKAFLGDNQTREQVALSGIWEVKLSLSSSEKEKGYFVVISAQNLLEKRREPYQSHVQITARSDARETAKEQTNKILGFVGAQMLQIAQEKKERSSKSNSKARRE